MLNSKLNFSTVEGFNSCVGYVKITGVVSRYVTLGCNFADIVDNFSDKLDSSQLSFLLSSILVDKFRYMYLSFNMTRKISNLSQVYSKLCKWNQFNTVVVYYHPQLGVIVLNPQDNRGWQNIEFVPSEFVSIYTKPKQDLKKEQTYDYLVDVKKVIEGDTTSDRSHYTGLTSVVKNIKQVKMDLAKKQSAKVDKSNGSPDEPIVVKRATSPQQARIAQAIEHSVDKPPEQTLEKPVPPSTVQEKPKTRRLTPKYSVQVSNELFHNGNVEAWKNIMESYTLAHPDLQVILFHNDEVIKNVNSLFKWGKVKHGDIIFFSLAGENFRSVSKLQKYLYEGASNRFQQFLKKDLGQPLRLF